MGFVESMRYRDCPWCSARYVQMWTGNTETVKVKAANSSQREWKAMFCPACGGGILVEVHPQANYVVTVVPEDTHTHLKVDHLPDDVGQYYSDALTILQAGIPDGAAVQLRRTLEAAAAAYNAEDKTLMRSIENLIKSGNVTAQFGDALHLIRQVGNVGAHHTDKRLDTDTVTRALKFTAALLRDLFEIPEELRRATEGTSNGDESEPSSP